MADERIDSLKRLALFSHLSDAKLVELGRFLKELKFKSGDAIFEEGSRGDCLFLVAGGHVRIEKKLAGADDFKLLARLAPGDFFGEMALIEETPRSARAEADGDTTVLMLSRKELFDWLNSAPVMALGFFVELLRVFSQRLRRTSTELALLYDVGQLILQPHESPKAFVTEVLKRSLPHLEGHWTAAGYVYNNFNDELERVAVLGDGDTPAAIEERGSAWSGATTYRAELPGEKRALGYLLFMNSEPMSPREKDEAAIAFSTVAHLVSSVLQNMAHRAEEEARARLEQQTRGSVPM